MSSQSGSLGISIAGGKGSLPYKDQDEVSSGTTELAVLFSQANLSISFQGIFISRVNKEGASGKAGVHVGDRLLEVGWESFFPRL